ncbi:autotransporter outer membrane beta-barrel domain-containing protein [Phascolarctobacterium faecium]|uniref:autotransporter outer membrane beta-barrel domain-containing protein n=1 Tax=Phascolarctobacterium faecium TaxID=33025 RepID=UPI00267041E5|nr:autotransporter outer membrane beta-barrel domain-containing protein [Phascolarctobacterium faecium]
MNKRVLSKKVMISLLTISCVYLGGTSALPIAEAVMVDGQNVASGTKLNFPDNHTINKNLNDGAGIRLQPGENITINADGNLNILGNGKKIKEGYYITYVYAGANLDFTGKNIFFSGSTADGDCVNGILANGNTTGSTINFKNDYTKLTCTSTDLDTNDNHAAIYCVAAGVVNFDHAVDVYASATHNKVFGIYMTGNKSLFHAKDRVSIETVGGNMQTGNNGIMIQQNSSALFEGALSVKVSGDIGSNIGIMVSTGGKIEMDDSLKINVSGTNSKGGLWVQKKGSTAKIKGVADISFATGTAGNAVVARDSARIDFENAVFINKDNSKDTYEYNKAISIKDNGTININQSGGKQVVIKGGITVDNGNLNLTLDRADSVLEGFIFSQNGGNAVVNLDNSSLWRLSKFDLGNSVASLMVNNGATVDMTFDDTAATKLAITDYSGTGGNFIMDTDLAAETGDKVNITSSAAGTTYVQVKDASLVNGHTVTGAKNLLLITDASQNVNFVGKNLNAGGLWDVTPTLENGENVTLTNGSQGTKDQWYLTKMAKQVNNDTKVLLESGDGNYALWRNTGDTLRKRLGDLHNYRDTKVESDGIWSRYIGGKFGSGNFDGSFNMYQLGYDKAANAKSIYGFAVENGSGHTSYSYGSGKDKLFAGSIYGTWHGDNSSYTDVVARFGQFDTDIRSYGDYPDKAKAKSRAYSLSVEYGKTIELNKAQGTFIEPQAQLIIGRLGSSSYTTDRGNNVYMGGVNSCIGRLGVVAGKKDASGNDVYLKVNMLHEFGGNRDVRMLAGNGETLSESQDYGDTWFELGLGGNIKLGNSSHLYGDIERSFGADIQKKWQVNAGVRFEF